MGWIGELRVPGKAVPPMNTILVREVRTQDTEQVRDRVIPLDLWTRDTELRWHRVQLVGTDYSPNRVCIRTNVFRTF